MSRIVRAALTGAFAVKVMTATAGGNYIVLPDVYPVPLLDAVPSKYRAAVVDSEDRVYAIKVDNGVDVYTSEEFKAAGFVLRERDPYARLRAGTEITSTIDTLDTSTYAYSVEDSPGAGIVPAVDGLKPTAPSSDCNDADATGLVWFTGAGGVFLGYDLVGFRTCKPPTARITCDITWAIGNKLPQSADYNKATSALIESFCRPMVMYNGAWVDDRYWNGGKYIEDEDQGVAAIHPLRVGAHFTSIPYSKSAFRYKAAEPRPPQITNPGPPPVIDPGDPNPRSAIEFQNLNYRQLTKTFTLGRGATKRVLNCFAVVHKKLVVLENYRSEVFTDSGFDWFIAGDCDTATRMPTVESLVPVGSTPESAAQITSQPWTQVLFDPTFVAWSASGEDTGVFVDPSTGRAWWFNWPYGTVVEFPGWHGATPVSWHYGVYKAAS